MKRLFNSFCPPHLPLTMLELMPENCCRLMPAFEANTVWGKWEVVSIDFMQGVSLIFSRDCRTKFFVTAVNC